MATVVDEKVVEMKFDNRNFEKNVQTSMNTLDKLKAKLKFEDSANSLKELEKSSNNIKFDNLVNTVDKLASKFESFKLVGTMAMINIANAAANAGISMVKSLSVDNIFAGWNKLQQKANSMSTLISQGYKTEVVEKQLEKLNWFSDETSYNFTDMIDNIAKFTATGKGLEDSVTAMQGIALWAAKSGQNAQKASAAMYQLSQALGAGVMRKEDWKSIQNASMDTDEFRQKALDTAVALGTLKKVGENTYQALTGNKKSFTKSQFAEELTEGQWFNSDVMMEVYKQYAKASDQMKKAIDKMADDHNITLTAGQMIKAYDALKNNTFDNFLKEEEIDDKKAIEALKNMVAEFDEFGISTFRAGQEYRTFNDTIDATKDAVSTKWMNIIETLIGNIDAQKALWTTIGEKFYDWFAAPLDDLQELLNRWVDMGGRDSLHEAIGNIGKAISAIVSPIKEAWNEIFPSITAKRLTELTNKFKDFTSKLIISGKAADKIKNIFKSLFSVLKTGWVIFKNVAGALIKLVSTLKPLGELLLFSVECLSKWISKVSDAIRNSKWLSDTINGIVNGIKKFTEAIGKMIKKLLSYESLVNFFKGLFNLIKNIGLAIGKFIGGIIHNGDLNQFIKIINSGLLGTLIYKTTSWMSSLKKLTDGFKDNVIGILKQLKDVLGAYEKDINAKTLLKIAVAVGILAGSIWVLSGIDGASLIKSIGAMTSLIIELMAAFKVFTMLSKDQKILARNSLAIVSLSASLLILSVALKNIGSLSFGQMITGLIGLAGAIGIIVMYIKLIPNKSKVERKTKGLISLALSLLIMSVALKNIGSMDIISIVKGLAAMLAYMLIVVNLLNKMNPEGSIKKSIALSILATSLIVLSGALKILGSMSWNEIIKGLTAMGIALGILVLTMNLLNSGNKSAMKVIGKGGYASAKSSNGGAVGKSFALLGATLSLVVLGGALKILATMNWDDIKRSLTVMGGALAELVIAMKILGSNTKSGLAGAGSLIIASIALINLALGLKVLASIEPERIAKALLTLAGALAIFAVAGYLLKGVALELLTVAGAAALFGLAAVTLGIGLGLIAAGISALALALSAGTTAIVAGLSAIIMGILGLVPEIVKVLGLVIIELCKVLIDASPLIAKALGTVLLETVKMLKDFVPPIVDAILELVIQVLKTTAKRIPELIVSIAEVLSAIFKGFMDALNILDSKTLIGGIQCIGMLIIVFGMLAGLVVLAPLAALGVVAFGGLLIELMAVMGLVAKFKNKVSELNNAGDVLQAVGTAIGKFIGGIIGGFSSTVSNALPIIANNLSLFMNNLKDFIEGAKSIDLLMLQKITMLSASILVLTAANLIAGITQLLSIGNSLPNLGNQLSLFMMNIRDFIDGCYDIDPNMLNSVTALAEAIIVLTGANLLKNLSDGIAFFTGGNSFKGFADELKYLGIGLRNFINALGTITPQDMASINYASISTMYLANASRRIPNSGGVAGFFAGENDVDTWAKKLPMLGVGLRSFITSLGNFDEGTLNIINYASQAVVLLAKAGKEIPNSGGIVSLVTGDNDIGVFGVKLVLLGSCLRAFSNNLGSFDEKEISKAKFAAETVTTLAKAANNIPNSGGIVSLLTGDNDIAVFGSKLPLLGLCLSAFAKTLSEYSEKDIKKSEMAANTVAILAKVAKDIPVTGGLKTLFTGDNDITSFSAKLPLVGTCMSNFISNLKDFNNKKLGTVKIVGEALTSLIEASSKVPTNGGLKTLFTGNNDITSFGIKLPFIGTCLSAFITNLGEIESTKIDTAKTAAEIIAVMAEASSKVPTTGGIKQLFTGNNDISSFAESMEGAAKGLSSWITEIPSFENAEQDINNAKTAAEIIGVMAEAASKVPASYGIKQLFTGNNDISSFAESMEGAAKGLSGWFKELPELKEGDSEKSISAIETIKAMAEVASKIPETGGLKQLFNGENDISKFADKFESVGKGLNAYITKIGTFGPEQLDTIRTSSEALVSLSKISNIDGEKLNKKFEKFEDVGINMSHFLLQLLKFDNEKMELARNNTNSFVEVISKFNELNVDNINTLNENLTNIANNSITDLYNALTNNESSSKIISAVETIVNTILSTLENKRKDISDKFKSIIISAYDDIKSDNIKDKFKELGKSFAEGFANGINANRYLATKAGRSLGNSALEAARRAIDSNSPSKETYKLGGYFGLGFINGVKEYTHDAYNESYNMAEEAKKGLSRAIVTLNDVIEGNIDSQPTIRPILDLSDVTANASSLNNMFNNVGIGANLNAISKGMNNRIQNGTTDDVIHAINKLGKNIGSGGDTYNINGVKYDDESSIQDAVRVLIRAANIERRT